MKPITIICQCLLLTTVALGQGSVFFRNKILGQAGGVDVPFFDDQGVPLEGSNYVAQLYAWNEGDGFQPVGAPVPFATNGYFYGAEVVVPFVQGCLQRGSRSWHGKHKAGRLLTRLPWRVAGQEYPLSSFSPKRAVPA